VEDLFRNPERFLACNKNGDLILPGAHARQVLSLSIRATDVPARIRGQWLHRLALVAPPLAGMAERAMARLRRSRSRAQYDMFFSVAPLVHFVHHGPVANLTLSDLRAKLILSLRLHTLARSADLANIPSVLFTQQEMFFIRFVDKPGRERLVSIAGRTLSLLAAYLSRVSSAPCLFLLRHLSDPRQGLSAERIAKECLVHMTACGIDTAIFKSHSVRGAATTAMMAAGVPQELARQRGGWSDLRSFEKHYARLHQTVDWEACLCPVRPSKAAGGSVASQGHPTGPVGEPEADIQAPALVLSPGQAPSPCPEPTQEGEGHGDEPARGEALRLLNATGLVSPLGGGRECPACTSPIRFEPPFVCRGCSRLVHVRCLAPLPAPSSAPTAPLRSNLNPTVYSDCCILCSDRPRTLAGTVSD
jgi:hypothetical protein